MKPFKDCKVIIKMKDKKHKHGFKTPEDYFESFEERLFNKLSEGKLPEKSGFIAPEGYLDSFEDRLLKRIEDEKSVTKVRPLFGKRTLMYAAAIAACAVLVFSVFNLQQTKSIQIQDLQLSSIENYIDEGNLELETYEVLALFEDEEVTNLALENNFFSEENLEEYLLENLDDTTLLIE